MNKKHLVLLTLTLVLLSVACSSDDNPPFPNTDVSVRLKHLLTTSEVVGALGGYTTGWDIGDLNVTNHGSYPTFPYIYYYRLTMRIETLGSAPQTKIVRAEAGGSVDADVTLEQFLEENEDYVAINDLELNNYPRTYIVKKKDNDNDEWIIELYTPHIAQNGNKTMHSIRLYGTHTPPPSDAEAVDALLGLVEKDD